MDFSQSIFPPAQISFYVHLNDIYTYFILAPLKSSINGKYGGGERSKYKIRILVGSSIIK